MCPGGEHHGASGTAERHVLCGRIASILLARPRECIGYCVRLHRCTVQGTMYYCFGRVHELFEPKTISFQIVCIVVDMLMTISRDRRRQHVCVDTAATDTRNNDTCDNICKLDNGYDGNQLLACVRRTSACAVGLAAVLYWRMWMMNFQSPTFTKFDNPAAFHKDRFVRVGFEFERRFIFSTSFQAINYMYIYVLNVQLLMAPAHLCFDYSMGCIALIEDVLCDTRTVVVAAAIVLTILAGRRVWSIRDTNTKRYMHPLHPLCPYLPFLQTSSCRRHSDCCPVFALREHVHDGRLRACRTRAVLAVDWHVSIRRRVRRARVLDHGR
jgi:hypothetical protein